MNIPALVVGVIGTIVSTISHLPLLYKSCKSDDNTFFFNLHIVLSHMLLNFSNKVSSYESSYLALEKTMCPL